MQEPGRFLQRIRAVGDDDATHLRIRQQHGAARRQRAPYANIHVLAVDLRHLLGLQRSTRRLRQARHGVEQCLHAELGRLVAHVVASLRGRPGDGSACTQHHDVVGPHLPPLKNWLKIQLLDLNPYPISSYSKGTRHV